MSVLSARQPRGVRNKVLADPTSSARSVRSSANRSAANFPRHRHRNPDPLRPEPADHVGQFVSAALDAFVGPVNEAQRAVGGQV